MVTRVADRDVVILGAVRAHDGVRRAERREDAVVAVLPVEDVRLGDRVGLDPADLGGVAVDLARVGADARHDLRARATPRARRRPLRRTACSRRATSRRSRPTTCSSIASRFEAFIPFVSVAMNATSAMPIISAAAVAAVRLGLRTELPLASRPAAPPARRAGVPDDRGDRLDEVRREHRDAEEEEEHTARDREQAIAGAELVREHRAREEERASRRRRCPRSTA